jgi:hypothetical protein
VDPIAAQYPELTPYQFASNTPIQAIDLDGLEAFIIHGTNESSPRFTPTSIEQFKRITGNTVANDKFSWGDKAGTLNSRDYERKVSAEELVSYIETQRSALMKKGEISESEPVSLVGYSHGGNVAIQAIKILKDKYNIKVNLLTISTPAYNEDVYNVAPSGIPAPTMAPNPENPADNDGINAHTHIVHEKDHVVDIAGGSHVFKKSSLHDVNNIMITDKDLPIPYKSDTDNLIEFPDFIRYHTKIPVANGIERQFEKIPTMKPVSTPTVLSNG